MSNQNIDEVKDRLKQGMLYFRGALNKAAKEGNAKMAIITKHADGGGRILIEFDCEDFFKDIETVLGMEPQTMEEDMQYEALEFLTKHGLKVSGSD